MYLSVHLQRQPERQLWKIIKKIIRGGTFITMDESYGDIVNGVYGQGMQIYDF